MVWSCTSSRPTQALMIFSADPIIPIKYDWHTPCMTVCQSGPWCWPNHVVQELVPFYKEYVWVRWWSDGWSQFPYKNGLIRLAKIDIVVYEWPWDWNKLVVEQVGDWSITLVTNDKQSTEKGVEVIHRLAVHCRFPLHALFCLVWWNPPG